MQVLRNIIYLSRRGCVIPPLPLKNTGRWGGVAWRWLVPELSIIITLLSVFISNTYKLYRLLMRIELIDVKENLAKCINL